MNAKNPGIGRLDPADPMRCIYDEELITNSNLCGILLSKSIIG